VQANADNLKLMGDAAYIAEQPDKAIDAYRKAMPLAKDGEPALRAGQLLLSENKYGEAKSLIQQGIGKGRRTQRPCLHAVGRSRAWTEEQGRRDRGDEAGRAGS